MEIYNDFLKDLLASLLSLVPLIIVITLSMVLLNFFIGLFRENPELGISAGIGISVGFMLMFLL